MISLKNRKLLKIDKVLIHSIFLLTGDNFHLFEKELEPVMKQMRYSKIVLKGIFPS